MIVFPMAGLSSRFAKAGYAQPKYMLPLGQRTVFDEVVSSFDYYFKSHTFVFICRDIDITIQFIKDHCISLGIARFEISVLQQPTRGQAETVALGLKRTSNDLKSPLTIFNIDTIRPHFRFPDKSVLCALDGFLEVFKGEGEGWSFAKTVSEKNFKVVETAEKRRISDLCSTGLYYFSQAGDFLDSFSSLSSRPQEHWDAQELYVAPLYNRLIAAGKRIIAVEVSPSEMIPCGIPAEYEALNQNIIKKEHDKSLQIRV